LDFLKTKYLNGIWREMKFKEYLRCLRSLWFLLRVNSWNHTTNMSAFCNMFLGNLSRPSSL
jgi:hypothetical protein